MFVFFPIVHRLEHPKSARKKYQLRVLYRAHQVYHNFHVYHIQISGPVVISVAEALTIIGLYSTIRLGRFLGPFLLIDLIIVDVLCILVIQIVMKYACKMTDYSTVFSKYSTMCTEEPGGRLTVEEKKFFKSCRPLRWKLSDCFTVTRNSFPNIIDQIIIQSVINLLIFN